MICCVQLYNNARVFFFVFGIREAWILRITFAFAFCRLNQYAYLLLVLNWRSGCIIWALIIYFGSLSKTIATFCNKPKMSTPICMRPLSTQLQAKNKNGAREREIKEKNLRILTLNVCTSHIYLHRRSCLLKCIRLRSNKICTVLDHNTEKLLVYNPHTHTHIQKNRFCSMVCSRFSPCIDQLESFESMVQ